jgi:transposase InsO family protein
VHFGVPVRIIRFISDRGSAFTSRTFRLFCEAYAVRHVLKIIATPRANGRCEGYNKTIVTMLATTAVDTDGDRWVTHISHIKELQSAINTSFNKGIKTTPVSAPFGYQTQTMAEAKLLNSLRGVVDRIDLTDLRAKITKHVSDEQRKQKPRYDKTRRDAEQYEIGDLVSVVITSEPCTGSNKKLFSIRFVDPLRVTRVIGVK